jgi:prepilin-type processing-associated H-X9-DG protein
MFKTHDQHVDYHTVARAMSGGPVYITDIAGRERFDVLWPLILQTGELLRVAEDRLEELVEWMQPAEPYYKQGKMRFCPMVGERKETGRASWGDTFKLWESPPYKGSYGINEFLFNPKPGVTDQWGHSTKMNWRTKNVAGASNIPAFADCLWVGGCPDDTDDPPTREGEWNYNFGDNMKRFCLNRHNEAINAVFLDWSVQRVRLKSLWRFKWSRDFQVNAPLPVWPEWMEFMPEPDR